MRSTATLLSVAGQVLISLAEGKRASLGIQKRALESCEETYGPGSLQCGDTDSTYCYNPSLGQSCCMSDNGYCDQGEYCAPVAGYCCMESEDLEKCAQSAGFLLPAAASGAVNQTLIAEESSTATEAPIFHTPEAQSILGGDMIITTHTTVSAGFPTSSANISASSVAPSNSIPTSSNQNGSFIQVSIAKKEQWRLALMGIGIGAVGIFMFSC